MGDANDLRRSAEEARTSFNRQASTYDFDSFGSRHHIAQLIYKANIRSHDSVLDMATGTGCVARAARVNTDGQVVGIDISEGMLAEAEKRNSGNEITFRVGNMATINGRNSTERFDVITCCSAIANIPWHSRAAVLQQWSTLLTPGGRIVITTIHPYLDIGSAVRWTYNLRPVADGPDQPENMRVLYNWSVMDETTVTEARDYGRELGEEAGLQLVGEIDRFGLRGSQNKMKAFHKSLENDPSVQNRSDAEARKEGFLKTKMDEAQARASFPDGTKFDMTYHKFSVIAVWKKAD